MGKKWFFFIRSHFFRGINSLKCGEFKYLSKCYKLKILIFEIIKLIWWLSDQISEWNVDIWRIFSTKYRKNYKKIQRFPNDEGI